MPMRSRQRLEGYLCLGDRNNAIMRSILTDHGIELADKAYNTVEEERNILEPFHEWLRTVEAETLTPGDVKRLVKLDLWSLEDEYHWKQYKVTQREWHALGNRCECCGRTEAQAIRLEADYKPYRKLLIGKLCHRCKTLMGMGDWQPDILRKAAAYIERKAEGKSSPPVRKPDNISDQANEHGD